PSALLLAITVRTISFFIIRSRPPPHPPLFPYTTLFRSLPSTSMKSRRTPSSRKPDLDSTALLARLSGRTVASTRCSPTREKQWRSEEHTSELQSRFELVCRLLLEQKKEQIERDIDSQRQ